MTLALSGWAVENILDIPMIYNKKKLIDVQSSETKLRTIREL